MPKIKTEDDLTDTNSISALKIGGKKIPCSQREFDKKIEGKIYSQCHLENVGTFYFVFRDEVFEDDGVKSSLVDLMFYNREEKTVHTSRLFCLYARRDKTISCRAINQNFFIFDDDMVTLDDEWNSPTLHLLGKKEKLKIVDHLANLTSVHRTGLARIKQTAATDFTLECEEGEPIEVHRSVVEGLWPLLQSTINPDSEGEEVAARSVKLSMPHSTLRALVRYLYGEQLDLSFKDAAYLILYAQVYELPELLDLCIDKVKSSQMSIGDALHLWEMSYEAENEHMREHASDAIEKLMPDVDDFHGWVAGLDKTSLVYLFGDVAMSAKRRKKN